MLDLIKKRLTINTVSKGGRSNRGKITAYHRGGGHKRRYRFVDFERSLLNVPGVILKIESDPMRTGNIGLVCYSNGIVSYILVPEGLKEGDYIITGNTTTEDNDISRVGSIINLRDGVVGEFLCNVELVPGKGGQVARSAGGYVQFVKKFDNEDKVLLKLRSGEHRIFSGECKATVGIVSDIKHRDNIVGKAGVKRWLGRRPVVRGVAMNPVDHPHGGGEGKKSGRNKTPWGRITKGRKTRKKNKINKLIVKKL